MSGPTWASCSSSEALGYAMSTLKWPRAPLMLAFVLGPLVERRVLLSNALYGWSWLLRPSVPGTRGRGPRIALSRATREPAEDRSKANDPQGVGAASRCPDEHWFRGRWRRGPCAQPFVDRPRERVSANRLRCDVRVFTPTTRTVMAQGRVRPIGAPAAVAPRRTSHPARLVRVLCRQHLGLRPGHRHRGMAPFVYLRWEARESWQAALTITAVLCALTWVLVPQLLHLSDHGVF